jgi:glyoxylase-like metal-dependent hydrolase (beta-lactamase superfamily II)
MVHIIDLEFQGYNNSIASFLIETASGPIIIETGPATTLPALRAGIEKAGFKVQDIKHVFITHIHLDHAGAAWWFAQHGAKIYLHPFGVPHLADPSKLLNSAKRIYKEEMERLWGDLLPIPSDQLIAMEDKESINFQDFNIKAHHTPGHAIHHIAWQINNILFTGDVAGVKIGKGPVQAPCPPPDIDLDDWKKSIDNIKKINPEVLYLTHFGKIQNVNEHLYLLEEALMDWALWVKNDWQLNKNVDQITDEFKIYVRDQLKNGGVDNSGLNQYEAANPAWMSVNGLIRYWTKSVNKK